MDEIKVRQGSPTQSLAPTGVQAIAEQEVLDIAPEEFRHVREYLHIILKRRWAVLTCLLVVFSTVAIGTLKQKRIYQGKVVLEINPEPPNVLNFKEVLQIDTADVDSYRETQYRVIQSRTLAEHVVQALQLYKNPEFYVNRRLFGLIKSPPDQIPSSTDPGPPDTNADYYRNSVDHFNDSVDVAPVRRSNLVEVSFRAEDPQMAARIANQLATDYIDQNLQVKWDETVKASEWLQGQLVGLKGKLEKADDALHAYAQANSILFVEDNKDLASVRLTQLQDQYTKAQGDRFQKESLYGLVQAGMVQDLPGFLDNNLIQSLAIRLAELQRDYAELTATVKPDYPKAVALKQQMDTLQAALDHQKGALAQNIVDSYRSAVANEQYLAQALDDQKKIVNEISDKSVQYNILKREVDTSQELYEGLLQRLKEAQVSAGLKASNIRVVDSAEVPDEPVRPRVVLNLALGLILGLGLGIGLALFQEYLDNTLKTPDQVENLLRLPSLGVLPSMMANGTGKAAEDKSLSITSAQQTQPSAPGCKPIRTLSKLSGLCALRSCFPPRLFQRCSSSRVLCPEKGRRRFRSTWERRWPAWGTRSSLSIAICAGRTATA